jgi:hypothetical protein
MIHEDFIAEMKKLLPEEEIQPFLIACDKPLKKSISVCLDKISPERFEEITKPR